MNAELYRKTLEEPYRLFFPLAWLAAVWGVGRWLLFGFSQGVDYNPLLHGLIQIQLFCGGYVVGFLLTAVPKFLRVPHIAVGALLLIVVLYLSTALALALGYLQISQWVYLALLFLVLRFFIRSYRQRATAPPPSFLMLPWGFLSAILGILLILFPLPSIPLLGRALLFQGFVLPLVVGVGAFLGPKLMGHLDGEGSIVRFGAASKAQLANSKIGQLYFGSGLLLLASFFVEFWISTTIGQLVRAAAVIVPLIYSRALKFPARHTPVGIIVWLALVLVVLSLLLTPLGILDPSGAAHLLYIGGFTLIIFGIATQVSASHGATPQFWRERLKLIVFGALALVIAALGRALALNWPTHYQLLLGVAAAIFLLGWLLWGVYVNQLVTKFKR